MRKLYYVLGALMLIGSGCLTVNVDINENSEDPSGVSISVETEEVLEMAAPSANISVFEPLVDQVVDTSIYVEGEARVFEQTFTWRLTDVLTGDLIEDHENTSASDIGVFGPFSFSIEIPAEYGSELLLEVFEYSAMDGSQINTVTVPLVSIN
ncbi:TPA: hypothetical protein DEB00_01555 [Candidatus Uhrbacteria bacterium]|nr:hypothetical protein [Candidatus Uhrbacteria bacterium]